MQTYWQYKMNDRMNDAAYFIQEQWHLFAERLRIKRKTIFKFKMKWAVKRIEAGWIRIMNKIKYENFKLESVIMVQKYIRGYLSLFKSKKLIKLKFKNNIFERLTYFDRMKLRFNRSENDGVKLFKAYFKRLFRRKTL